MSVLNPKTRLVSFRLSQQEYSELCALCAAQQARSISDFVRDKMHWLLEQHGESASPAGPELLFPANGRPGPSYSAQHPSLQDFSSLIGMMVSLHRRTDALDRRVHHLARIVRSVAGVSPASISPGEEPGDSQTIPK